VFYRSDYSQVPSYAFDSLNDLNTKIIDASVSSVDVSIFSITIPDNPDALIRAAGRGVKVRVIVDEGHVYPKATKETASLMNAPGIEFRTLRGTNSIGVNHNKIVIGDRAIAAVGSYNWTYSATHFNHENTFVMRDGHRVSGYSSYFDWMWSAARTPAQGPSPELPVGYYGVPPQDPSPRESLNGTPVPAYLFSPGSDSQERLAEIIDSASGSLDVVTYTFSSKVLSEAVVRAKARGLRVRFMMDKQMAKGSIAAKTVFDGGVEMRLTEGRTEKGAFHNKFAILDRKVLETGSFNWAANASVNSFENIVFTSDPETVKAYQSLYDGFYSRSFVPSEKDLLPDPVPAGG